jgi:hypothetical protein
VKHLVDTYEFRDGDRVLFRKHRYATPDGKRFAYECPCRVPEKYRTSERWALGKRHKPNDRGWKGCVGDVVADHWLFIPSPVPRGGRRLVDRRREGRKGPGSARGSGG